MASLIGLKRDNETYLARLGASLRRALRARTFAAIAGALLLALVLDYWLLPIQHATAFYAIPLLIAARRWSPRQVGALAALIVVCSAWGDWPKGALLDALFGVVVLLGVGYLAVRLSILAEESSRRTREAEAAARTLRALIDTIPAGVVVSDITGELTLANPAARALLGDRPGNAYGAVGVKLLRLDGSPFPVAELPLPRALERGEATREVQILARRDDGSESILSMAGAPVRDAAGQVVAALAVFDDITERYLVDVALRESEARYRRIVETAGEGVWVLDADHNTVFANRRMAEMLGCTLAEMAGQPLLAYTDDEGRAIAVNYLRRRGRAGVRQQDFKFRRKDGSTLWAIVSVTPILDHAGRYTGALAMVMDITERKRAEQTRDEYLGLISHDLRQPLTVISGMAEWLYGNLSSRGLEREAGAAERIVRSGKRMATMIKDLVESVRLESGNLEMHKESTDLRQLLRDLVEQLGTEQERIQLLAAEGAPRAVVDAGRLGRAVVNLISNALKYSPPDRPVVVSLAEGEGEVVISVRDEGVGIPSDEQPCLFQRFYRASTCQRSEGLGLGLYIARLIVEAHGGRIWVESAEGQGSTFSVALPLDRVGEAAPA